MPSQKLRPVQKSAPGLIDHICVKIKDKCKDPNAPGIVNPEIFARRQNVIILLLCTQRCFGRHNVSQKSINH